MADNTAINGSIPSFLNPLRLEHNGQEDRMTRSIKIVAAAAFTLGSAGLLRVSVAVVVLTGSSSDGGRGRCESVAPTLGSRCCTASGPR